MARVWPFRTYVFAPISSQTVLNQYAASVDPDRGGGQTFRRRFSPNGEEPASHTGASIPVSAPMQASMDSVLRSGAVSGVVFYRLNADTNTLLLTNDPNANDMTGEPFPWAFALELMGLTEIIPAL
jgi:hypothetical protein